MNSMKGMELPINMIVVVLIAVLVLVTVGAFLAGQLGGGQFDIKRTQVFGELCQKAISIGGCSLSTSTEMDYADPLLGGQIGAIVTLQQVCDVTGKKDNNQCLVSCGCPPQ